MFSKENLKGIKKRIDTLRGFFDVESKKSILSNLETKASDPNFWSNSKDAEKIVKEIQQIKSLISEFDVLITKYDDIEVLGDFFK